MAEEAPNEAGKSGGKRVQMTLALIIGIAVIEGIGFFAVSKIMGGDPEPAYGEDQHVADAASTQPAMIEIELFNRFKIPNKSSGRLYIYDMDVWLAVPGEYQEEVEKLVKNRMGALSDCVARVVRSADPEVLDEPELKTLRVQIQHALLTVTRNEDMIAQVLIPRCVPMRAD